MQCCVKDASFGHRFLLAFVLCWVRLVVQTVCVVWERKAVYAILCGRVDQPPTASRTSSHLEMQLPLKPFLLISVAGGQSVASAVSFGLRSFLWWTLSRRRDAFWSISGHFSLFFSITAFGVGFYF